MSDMGATALTNELFYRNGRTPTALQPSDAMLVKETIERVLNEQHNALIEECAKVAETCHVWDSPCATIAAAIRALKDKP